MFAPLTIVCVLPIERAGRMHLPGERLTVPQSEAAHLIRAGFAQPEGVHAEADTRRIRGRFTTKARP